MILRRQGIELMSDIKKAVVLFCIFNAFAVHAFSESVYTVDLTKDLIIGGVSRTVSILPVVNGFLVSFEY
ncbi:hypothetical protein AGMMS50267_01250 [Spirochaetia bacterium]|nr:hypothetical protein AGMMS50267_01250 [Spirochaetia bacterium]